jgi:hypothetical protein
MPSGHHHEVAIVVREPIHHHEGEWSAIQNEVFLILPLQEPFAKETAPLFLLKDIGHPPGSPEFSHRSSFFEEMGDHARGGASFSS